MACDFELPCETCLLRGLICTNNRLLNNPSNGERESSTGDVGFEKSNSTDLGRSSLRHFYIPFLHNYTNPETQTLRDRFGSSNAIAERRTTSDAIIPLTFEGVTGLEEYSSIDNSFFGIGFDTSIDSFEGLSSDFIGNPFNRVQVADMLHEATPMDDMYMGDLRLEQLFFCANGARDECAERSYDVGQPLMNIGLGEFHEYRTSELLEDLKRFFLSLPPERQNLISTAIFGYLERIFTPQKMKNYVNAYFLH